MQNVPSTSTAFEPSVVRTAPAEAPVTAAAMTHWDRMLDDVRQSDAPKDTVTRRGPLRRIFRFLVASALLTAGYAGYRVYERQQRIDAVPTFDEVRPETASFWMSFEGRSQDGLPVAYRTQRSPGSESIVIEPESGFSELNGQTLLVSAEGVWLFDRQSGAVTPLSDAFAEGWARYNADSRLIMFSELVPDSIRPHTLLNDTIEPSARTPPPGYELTDYQMTLDFGSFYEADAQALSDWTNMIGVTWTVEENAGPRLPFQSSSTGDMFELEVTVDQDGLVWGYRLSQDDQLVASAKLDELSDVQFIPPDPTP